MAELFRSLVLQIISKECYEKYFYEMDFFDGKLTYGKMIFRIEINCVVYLSQETASSCY